MEGNSSKEVNFLRSLLAYCFDLET